MVVCKEGYILRIASSLYSPSCLQVHHVSETLSELRETYANISLYARSILESCAPLLMQTHGRDFFFWKRNLAMVTGLLKPCPCACVAPRLLSTAVREGKQLSLRATAKAICLNCIHSIRKDTGLKSLSPIQHCQGFLSLKCMSTRH